MIKYAILIGLLGAVFGGDVRASPTRIEDSLFSALDRGLTHTLAYHYLWPFSQIVRAAAALENDEGLELLQIQSDDNVYEINLNVRRFKPDELKIKVKNQYIVVEGKHKESIADRPILTNHFVQRFALPLGCKPEEVKAVLKQNGVLSVSAPKHKLPPPPPEREVPIEVQLPVIDSSEEDDKDVIKEYKKDIKVVKKESAEQSNEEKKEKVEEKKKLEKDNTTKKEKITDTKEIVQPSSESPLWQHLMDTTTHVGKIRKKELKSTTKTTKENEVTKIGEENGLDYLIDAEMEE